MQRTIQHVYVVISRTHAAPPVWTPVSIRLARHPQPDGTIEVILIAFPAHVQPPTAIRRVGAAVVHLQQCVVVGRVRVVGWWLATVNH